MLKCTCIDSIVDVVPWYALAIYQISKYHAREKKLVERANWALYRVARKISTKWLSEILLFPVSSKKLKSTHFFVSFLTLQLEHWVSEKLLHPTDINYEWVYVISILGMSVCLCHFYSSGISKSIQAVLRSQWAKNYVLFILIYYTKYAPDKW